MALDNKQKGIAAAFVVIVLIIIWQVAGLFSNGGSSSNVSKAPARAPAAAVPKPAPAAASGAMNQPSPAAVAPAAAPEVMTQANVFTIPNEAAALKSQQQDQKTYLDELNKLQVLKVQREIAETNQAIATAKLATATADKSMSDLLTKPAAPTLPASYYATSLGGPSPFQGAPLPQLQAKPTTPAAPIPVEAPYVVISVSMQFNKWTAVLGMQGKLYVVNIGDTLPDGSVVDSINKEGVVIGRDNKKRKISIISSI